MRARTVPLRAEALEPLAEAGDAVVAECVRHQPRLQPDHLGSGRIAASEIEAPRMSVNRVRRGRAVVQRDHAAEP